jgi:hypothetical protein
LASSIEIMAASIRDTRNDVKERKPVLIDRVESVESMISMAQILPKEDGFISISDDRLVDSIFI